MSGTAEDPRCPECGGKIGQTATYCMHCSTDLTDQRAAADADGDGVWDQSEEAWTGRPRRTRTSGRRARDSAGPGSGFGHRLKTAIERALPSGPDSTDDLFAPDGLADNTLTVLVGIVGGAIAGIIGAAVLGIVTWSAWGVVLGILGWLGVTSYIVRRRTVQAAISASAYAIGIALASIPVVVLSPFVPIDGGLGERAGIFFVLLLLVAVPAGIVFAVGWIAAQSIPSEGTGGDG